MPVKTAVIKTKKTPAPRVGGQRGRKTTAEKQLNPPLRAVKVAIKAGGTRQLPVAAPIAPAGAVSAKGLLEARFSAESGLFRAIGRRKEACARVRATETGKGEITINGRAFEKYFSSALQRDWITAPLKLVGQLDNHNYSVKVKGGGVNGQAGAVRHGLARILLQWNPEFRAPLKKAGFLRRDPRAKERKKFGLKGARRAPQWAKR